MESSSVGIGIGSLWRHLDGGRAKVVWIGDHALMCELLDAADKRPQKIAKRRFLAEFTPAGVKPAAKAREADAALVRDHGWPGDRQAAVPTPVVAAFCDQCSRPLSRPSDCCKGCGFDWTQYDNDGVTFPDYRGSAA